MITIDKAIEVLGKIQPSSRPIRKEIEIKALSLAIEALKRVRLNYLYPLRADFRPLPGEEEV